MATAQVTYTGKIGPGVTLTSKVFSGCTRVDFDITGQTVTLYGPQSGPIVVDLAPVTTITDTVAAAGGNHTIAIS